jgi:hypothetical protein
MFGSSGNSGQPEGDQYVGELQTAIEGAHRVARETLKQSQKRMKRDYDVKVKIREFNHELPSVWLLTNTIKLSSIPPLIFDAHLLLGISCPLNYLLTQFLSR